MEPLTPPDSFHVLAAEGWIELGCNVEAAEELAKVAPNLWSHPYVQKIRWLLSAAREEWVACVELGAAVVDAEPKNSWGWINRSYALRRAPGEGVLVAYNALLPAVDVVNDNGLELVTFNLACYACQLALLDEARVWINQSFAIARRHRHLEVARQNALNETDLAPLWPEMRKLKIA